MESIFRVRLKWVETWCGYESIYFVTNFTHRQSISFYFNFKRHQSNQHGSGSRSRIVREQVGRYLASLINSLIKQQRDRGNKWWESWGGHIAQWIAISLRTQWPRVWFSAFPRNILLMLLRFIDGTSLLIQWTVEKLNSWSNTSSTTI